MTPRVKICGLTRPQDVEAAIRHGADFLGFIVEAKSARRLSVRGAAQLASLAKGVVPTVAVMVNPDDELMEKVIAEMNPDFIQLHGDETPEHAAEIKSTYNISVIKALPVSTPDDLAMITAYELDFILLDAKAPKGEARGGHGLSFDWDMLKDVHLPQNWILAGGLTPDTVLNAAQQTKAPILDVSSGVEIAPGIKSEVKLRDFFKNLRD